MAGEAIAFEDWYRANHGAVLAALVLFCAGDHSRSEDATNEAFIAAFEEWPKVSQMESPVGWVVQVGINSVKRRSRRRKRRIELLNSQRIVGATEDQPRDVDVMSALAELSEKQRKALVLRYVADLTQAEVAAEMDVAVGTASATLSQARSRLRANLDESGS